MTAGEQTNRQPLDHFLLTDDDLPELRTERLVGFSKFIDGGNVIGRQLIGEIGGGFHGWFSCEG